MKRMTLFFLFVLSLLTVSSFHTRPAEAGAVLEPQPVRQLEPLTAEGLGAFVDQYVAQGMAQAHAPGLVVTVVYGGEVLLARGYGLADLQTGRPMTAQTNLRAGSVSKPVTSAGVLQLVARDNLSLHEPLDAYLSGLPLEDAYGAAGTVAQFLTLQGGYGDAVIQTHAPTPAQWQPLDAYLRDHLPARAMPPGRVLSYNSWEHALLGEMMAQQTALPFDQAMNELLFRPLGMAHSTFNQPLPEPIAANLARGYAYDGQYEEVPLDYVNLSPGIGLVTTGQDMGRFMLALLDGGRLDGEQVLAPATVRGMLQRQEAVHPLSRSRTYGFSEVTLADRQVLYHDGNGIGHGNRMILAPQQGLGIFLSTNHRPLDRDLFSSTPAYDFMRELGTALLQEYLPTPGLQPASTLPPLPDAARRASRYAGHYRPAGTPQQDFFKLGALLDNVAVTDNGDGTITIGSRRYAEVQPRLFQNQADPHAFVVFVEDEAGEVRWLTFGGTASYQKVRWYEMPAVQAALAAFTLLGFLAFAVVMPFSSRRHWTLWLLSLLGLAFFGGLALLMTQADLLLFFKTIPPAAKALFLAPWLIGALALTYPRALATLRRERSGASLWLLYTLNMAATAGFMWFVTYWNLYLR